MSKVTIEHISRHTGLSRGTISRALNDRPDISQKTKQRVLEVCAKLNYAPSHAARSLATGRTFAVAVLVRSFHSAFAAAFLRGAAARAAGAQYLIHPVELGPDADAAADRLKRLGADRIDGVISAAAPEVALIDILREPMGNRPFVSCWPLPGVACDVLTPDHREAGRLSARHILQRGIRELLYVHAGRSAAADERLAGFRDVCREHDIDPEGATCHIRGADDTSELDLAPVRAAVDGVRAIVAEDDELAVSLLILCSGLGRVPGRDVAIIGHGNERFAQSIHPGLSTVDLAGEEIGRRAMEVVLQRVAKTRLDAPQVTKVPPLLIVRASSRLAG
jgi:DNA-binding LacI/PurR family transcriptional regulator